MSMTKCLRCDRKVDIPPEMRPRIRDFRSKYPWVLQKDLAEMLNVSQMRISEIINANKEKGGE